MISVRNFCLHFALLTICLPWSGGVSSACDQVGKPEVFGIKDRWEVSGENERKQADFTKACGELIDCYGTEGASKRSCDRVYEKNLKGACKKAFEFKPTAFGDCMEIVDKATGFVMKADGATYRKLQRSAQAEKREADRKARAQARQAKVEERRNKRRDERLKSAGN